MLFNPENCLFPANADCKSEKIVELSKKIMEVDATPFYGDIQSKKKLNRVSYFFLFLGDIQSFHLKGDCRMFTKFLHYAIIFYGERVHFNLKVFWNKNFYIHLLDYSPNSGLINQKKTKKNFDFTWTYLTL